MSQEGGTLKTVVDMLSTCIDQRDTLIRERDEARAEVERLKTYIANNISISKAEAEQRGYRRGVQDAAKVADSRVNYYASFAAAQAVYDCSKAILALLEQPGEKK